MGACCCCCAARDGGAEEPLKTPLRPTRPDKAKPLAPMQSPEANGAAQEATPAAAMQSPEANGAVQKAPITFEMETLEANGAEEEEEEAPAVLEMKILEANGAKEEADAATLSGSPTSTRYADSPNESFEDETSGARWAFVGRGSNFATSMELQLITAFFDALVSQEAFPEALERGDLRRLFNKLCPWAGDDKGLYLHYGAVAGCGHQKTVEIKVLLWEVELDFTLSWNWDAVLDDEDFTFSSSG
eukprot:TRINITY_DN3758_c0_g1_i1.p1 TRINITY_DN3758_c0_g1~~TRINITY_DN3758_c0_g1_i1.p1  ORF type:complete len:255 (-),score=54.43 TRINITY_DN3758_c0_g1_i1:111-845(-)